MLLRPFNVSSYLSFPNKIWNHILSFLILEMRAAVQRPRNHNQPSVARVERERAMEPSLEQQSLTPIDLILVFTNLFLTLYHEGSPVHCDATQNQS